MPIMAKKKSQGADAAAARPKKGQNRSPAWIVYCRVDPALEQAVAAYQRSFEYEPSLTQIVERALKELLKKSGHWPPQDQPAPSE